MLDLINYFDNEYKNYCLLNDLVSGLLNLFVDYVYNNFVLDKGKFMIKKLFIGEFLNGIEFYRLIVFYFIIIDIFFEKIYEEGEK